jgi:peptidoglycan/xylan/chitin deacetylase (PgdA/CDA1 family)
LSSDRSNEETAVRGSLDRLLAPLENIPLDDAAGNGTATWLRTGNWRLYVRPRLDGCPSGEEIERFSLDHGGTVSATSSAQGVFVPFSLEEAYRNYISEQWRTAVPHRQLSAAQLSLFYRLKPLIPRQLQLAARRILVRRQGRPSFPAWPLDESVTRLVHFYARCLLLASNSQCVRFRWFWPGCQRSALILTHDVESAAGLRLAVDIADVEEERGFRSSFNIVASWYPIDAGIVRELSRRGFELGVHGVYHDRSMFSSRTAFEAQQPLLREAVRTLRAEGFRSPATHRVFEWLGELPVSYDCSIPHSDPFEPQPGGCCTPWPFFIGDVVELPYTMPQDHTLLTLLRQRSLDLWHMQLDRIDRLHGLAQILTHPDPGYLGDRAKRDLYTAFLDAVGERPGVWRALPREVAAWWRQRDLGVSGRWALRSGTISLREPTGEVELRPPSGEDENVGAPARIT